MPLVAHEKAAVWSAAFNVLADFANQVAVPGREADQATVAASIMTLVRQGATGAVKIRGLRLLPIAVPQGCDVGPMAALLNDANLREKARAALRGDGHSRGDAPPCASFLPKADPEFQVAILNSLARLRIRAAIEAVHGPDEERQPGRAGCGGLRALSWTGDPTLSQGGQGSHGFGRPGSHSDAMDAHAAAHQRHRRQGRQLGSREERASSTSSRPAREWTRTGPSAGLGGSATEHASGRFWTR